MSVTAPPFEPFFASIASDEARTWTPPQGHADIAPSRFERIEGDGYLTHENPLVPDIEKGDIRRLATLEGFAWAVTNLPYGDLEELATHLIGLIR